MHDGTDLLGFRKFVRSVTECILVLVTTISEDECRVSESSTQFCDALAEQLEELGEQLDSLGDTNYRILAKILFKLEKLITWPGAGRKSTIEEGLAYPIKAFPALAKMLTTDDRQTETEKIWDFGLESDLSKTRLKFKERLFESLRSFRPDQAAEETDTGSKLEGIARKRLEDEMLCDSAFGFHQQTMSLYETLSRYSVCQEGEHTRVMVAKLGLNVETDSLNTTSIFGILFLSHPHDLDAPRCNQWLSTKIHVCLGGKSREQHKQEKSSIDDNSFCLKLRENQSVNLPLLLANECLAVGSKSGPSPSSLLVLDNQSYCLTLDAILVEKLLENTPNLRCLLAFLLARAFWKFIGTGWMSRSWTIRDVHFMSEKRGRGKWGYFLSEPFIPAKFDKEASQDMLWDPNALRDRIRAFGLLLLELEKGVRVEEITAKEYNLESPDDAEKLSIAYYISREPEVFRASIRGIREIIDRCLNCRFQDVCFQKGQLPSLRAAIHRSVVIPLRLISLRWETNLDDIILEPDFEREKILHKSPAKPAVNTTAEDLPKPVAAGGRVVQSPPSEPWFSLLNGLKMFLDNGSDGLERVRVRVAIFDTGLEAAKEGRTVVEVAKFRDFVSEHEKRILNPGFDEEVTTRIDVVGHGTKAVNLLRSIFPEAELYVGRVFQREEETRDTKDCILKAIEWAKEKKVHIIASGTGIEKSENPKEQERERKIEDAIRTSGIIFIAAAGNYGPIQPGGVRFPASQQDLVLGMFTTDARGGVAGNPSSYNPSAVAGKNNFAILGENVSYRAPDGSMQVIGGTTASTYIAAGLAGWLILASGETKDDALIFTYTGMSRVFKWLARGVKPAPEYTCVTLERLLKKTREMEVIQAREYIKKTLKRVVYK